MESPHISIRAARGGYIVECFDWNLADEDDEMSMHVFLSPKEVAVFVLKNLQALDRHEATKDTGPLVIPSEGRPKPWPERRPKG